jgi:hypothetical protein
MIFVTNFQVSWKGGKMDILKNVKASIPYFKTPCKIGKKNSFHIVSFRSVPKISLGFFYASEEAM